jgi:hypothetical protein
VKPEHMKLQPVAHQQAAQADRSTVAEQAERTVSMLMEQSVPTGTLQTSFIWNTWLIDSLGR